MNRSPLIQTGLIIALLAPLAQALPERTQLHVEVKYTRTAKLKSRLGPDNYERTDLRFELTAQFDTLVNVIAPQNFETWPRYSQVQSNNTVASSASLTASVEMDRPAGGAPKRTDYRYQGTGVQTETLQFSLESAYPVSPDQAQASIEFELPMSGQATGLPPGLDPHTAVTAVRYSPLRSDGNRVLCPVNFRLLPPAGPRPKDDGLVGGIVGRAYDLAFTLAWGGAGGASTGAPSLGWIGAKTTQGPDGLPVLTLQEARTWTEEADGGELRDTLTVTIRPVPITLQAIEVPAGLDDAARDAYVNAIVREARKIIGSIKKSAEAYPLILAHLEAKAPDLWVGDREMIAGNAVGVLEDKGVLERDDPLENQE